MKLMKMLRTTNILSEALDRPYRYKHVGGLPTFGRPTLPKAGSFSGARLDKAKDEPAPKRSVAARTGWMRKLNPFADQGAPIPRTAVQGELSLDKVKPVRNDLSDTDLILVAVKKPDLVKKGGATKIEFEEVPVVKATPWWEHARELFRRAPR
jgi:hypothetical protein